VDVQDLDRRLNRSGTIMKVERDIPTSPPGTYNGLQVKTSAEIRALLDDLRSGLEELYGDRLRGVYLFGSYARGEADAESDVDVLIVLDQIDHTWDEIRRTGYLASELSLNAEVTVSHVFIPEHDWMVKSTPFLENVRRDAIAA
jgi:predicted nucleotidyltransferase